MRNAEMINFISEYSGRCEQDIYHIPLVEKSKNEIGLKTYNVCRQIFEEYKKDPSKKFFYYDMNNSAQSRQYFDKLSEYKIHYKEWETIIRKVNQKESGLSELFADCKNEKELVEKWFMEAIENKLNREQNRMKEFQTIIEKYVRMYKDNKSKIERRDTILKFKEDMQEVEEINRGYKEAEEKIKESQNQIAGFLKELEKLEKEAEEALQKITLEVGQCEEKKAHIFYEKLSMEWHQLEDDLRKRSSNCEMIRQEMEDLEREIEKAQRLVHLFECALQQQTVDECEEEKELLKQKILASQKKEEELEPERNRLGGCLKWYYTNGQQKTKEKLENKEKEREQKKQQILEQKDKEKECQKSLENILVKVSAYKTRMEEFDRKEEQFNHSYGENFARNMLGDYEPGLLEIKKDQYEKQIQDTIREHKNQTLQQLELQEKKKAMERNREDALEKKRKQESDLQILQNQRQDYEEQIQVRRKIMRYLEVDEKLLWQKESIMEALEHKLTEIDRVRGNLEQEERELQKEWKKLTSGEILELPKDFQEMLEELELHPVYGMNWLEKNGYSEKENKKLVRTQPFLPYSLILPKAEIQKLTHQGKEIYTSYPIPLLARESLEEVLNKEESRVLSLSGVSFYLWFNEKLLDEAALHALIREKEEQLKQKKEQLMIRKKEYGEYSNKKSILENQSITKEIVDKNSMEQEASKEAILNLGKEIQALGESLLALENDLELLWQKIQEKKQTLEFNKRREYDFTYFCQQYCSYMENREKIVQCNYEKDKLVEKKKFLQELQEKYEEEQKQLELEYQQISKEAEKIQEKVYLYASYDVPAEELEDTVPCPTSKAEERQMVQEWEIRYEAITGGISRTLKELEEACRKAESKLGRETENLRKKQQKYGFQNDPWKEISYNYEEQTHQEIILEDRRRKYKGKELLWNEEDKKIAVLNDRIREKKKIVSEQCGYEEPLSKSEIMTKEFDSEINRLKHRSAELGKEGKKVEDRIYSLQQNLTTLSEYRDFVMTDIPVWDVDFHDMDKTALRNFTGTLLRDYRQDMDRKNQKKELIREQINRIMRKGSYQEDYYRKPLEAMLSVIDQANLIFAQLATTIQAYDSQMEKLAIDIAMVETEKAKIEGLLEDYVKDVHGNMSQIDHNSTITIRERAVKMLRLQIPDWEENEGLYRQRLEDYMDELTRTGVEIYEQNENPANYFSSQITTKALYDTIVGLGNIQIKLFKIEEQREYPITWAEVARNSGGEGFLSAFVILSSLLYYMRRDETDIFADRNEGKVLVMDNPFAQTNAAHLLKPLMDMAKKTNTQLICLSGLGGDSIYSRFDNIYVLNLVAASLRGGMQYLRGEHKRGNEEEVMVTSQIEVYEQQSLLF